MKECPDYFLGMCIKDIDSGRVWKCTCKNKTQRIKLSYKIKHDWLYTCQYPKLIKEIK